MIHTELKDLIGKKCLIKYDINLMLDRIFIITEVNEKQGWIRVEGGRWYRQETILKIGTDEELNHILGLHKILSHVSDAHRATENALKDLILEQLK